jgi:hypothetical protein
MPLSEDEWDAVRMASTTERARPRGAARCPSSVSPMPTRSDEGTNASWMRPPA